MSTQAISTPRARAASKRRQELLGTLFVNISLAVICLLWTIPTFGLFVSSFRPRDDISTSGWWAIFPHNESGTARVIELPRTIALLALDVALLPVALFLDCPFLGQSGALHGNLSPILLIVERFGFLTPL